MIVLRIEHHFRRSIVSRHHVLGHCIKVAVFFSGKAEVAETDVAVLIGEDVRWLYVSVDDASGVQELESSEDLVDDELYVVVGEFFSVLLDERVEVDVHEVGHQVDVSELGLRVLVVDDSLEVDDVVVSEVVQDADLSYHPPRVDGVFDLVHPLDGDLLVGLLVFVGPHDAVRALALDLDQLVAVARVHVVFFQVGHFSVVGIIICESAALDPRYSRSLLLNKYFESFCDCLLVLSFTQASKLSVDHQAQPGLC